MVICIKKTCCLGKYGSRVTKLLNTIPHGTFSERFGSFAELGVNPQLVFHRAKHTIAVGGYIEHFEVIVPSKLLQDPGMIRKEGGGERTPSREIIRS